MIRIIAVWAVVALAGCAMWEGIPESWHGAHIDALVASWGPPHRSHINSDGSRVISYDHQSQYLDTIIIRRCTATLEVDRSEIIRSSKVEGSLGGCNMLFSDLRRR